VAESAQAVTGELWLGAREEKGRDERKNKHKRRRQRTSGSKRGEGKEARASQDVKAGNEKNANQILTVIFLQKSEMGIGSTA